MDKIIISEDRYGRKINHLENDDLIDRLNSRYTVMVLVLCIIVVTGKLYVGNPINCWTPAQFTGTHNEYTNSICWLKGSYYLPTDEITIPDRTKPRIYYVSYYQWTPFILLGMALLFFFPRLLWHALTRQCGLDIQRTVKTIKDESDSEKSAAYARQVLVSFLNQRSKTRGFVCCCYRIGNSYSSFTTMYFLIKILYIINAVTQFILLNAFLAFQFTSYGFKALANFFSGSDWFESPRFPRVTMCDFMIRHLGSNQHWYAIQCNLPINMYNEKIFFGIWIWLIILTLLNIASMIVWSISLARGQRKAMINKYLPPRLPMSPEGQRMMSSSEPATTSRDATDFDRVRNLDDFIDYLKVDGFLIFRIIAHNTDDVIAQRILRHLYDHYDRNVRHVDTEV